MTLKYYVEFTLFTHFFSKRYIVQKKKIYLLFRERGRVYPSWKVAGQIFQLH